MEPVSFKKGYAQRNGPGGDCVSRPLVSELPAGSGLGGKVGSAEVLALGYEVGPALAAISFGLRQALRLGLRIADSLGQHLAQLSLGLRRFSREGFLPLGRE
jgi:hypothetical protein